MREALEGLKRYIVTSATAKHRVFTFVDGNIIPDNALVVIASDDAYVLGVLSSSVHREWEKATSSRMGTAYRYTQATTFDTFAFPNATKEQKQEIREIAEKLDSHRKERLRLYPKLTLTDMYNVLEKVRNRQELTAKEQVIFEQTVILRKLHNSLDTK